MDEKSYNYIKNFIEEQVREFNKPLELTGEIKEILADEGLNIKQFQIILMRLNLMIKRHNANMFPPRIVSQVTSQIIKSEQYKLELISERLEQVSKIMKPLIIPDTHKLSYHNFASVKDFGLLVQELPETKYLFVTKTTAEQSPIPEPEFTDEEDPEPIGVGLVQDFEERVRDDTQEKSRFKRRVYEQLDEQMGLDTQLIEQYEIKRSDLIRINDELQYKYNKMQYLKSLREKLASALGSTTIEDKLHIEPIKNQIPSQINRFKLLSDSIAIKTDSSSRQMVIDKLQQL